MQPEAGGEESADEREAGNVSGALLLHDFLTDQPESSIHNRYLICFNSVLVKKVTYVPAKNCKIPQTDAVRARTFLNSSACMVTFFITYSLVNIHLLLATCFGACQKSHCIR